MPDRAWGYFALFSEIGLVLLVTVLVGVLGGYWVDQQLRTLPIFVIVGLVAGARCGRPGCLPAHRAVPGDLRRLT